MPDTRRTHNVLAICDKAVEMDARERDRYLDEACGDDDELRRAVEAVLNAAESDGEFLEDSPLATSALIGECVGDYRVIELLGEGGMGAVFLAERSQAGFAQRVALKLIRGRFMAKDLLQRFDAERRVLARLNHPYIAKLIDGGTTDGVPYLVMEYVDGKPVDVYLDEQRASITERIEMLQKIALAVQSAHQNLVVHRDLKPSNVLVTTDGIPKLLDFGIAKLISVGDDEPSGNTTLYGQQAMTPDYASPEQILDNSVTTVSDVYTLGILAYELLVGERPYRIERSSQRAMMESIDGASVPSPSRRLDTIQSEELLKEIATARALTPERLQKALSGDLDNILMKALARDPSERYASVAAFSADLERHLEGRPIEAHPDSLAYRARRFVARNRAAVSFSVALFAMLSVGLAATSWSYLRAESARAESTARFDQVRSLARTMMFDVYDDVARVPGTTSARARIATTAQTYLEALAADDDAPADVRLDAGLGYTRLAAILNRQAVDDVGDRERGREAWDKAHGILTTLSNEAPDSPAVFQALGELLSNRGTDLTYIDNEAVEAREVLNGSIEAFDRARVLAPDDPEIAAGRLLALERMADTHKWQNNYEETERQIQSLISEIDLVHQKWPGDARFLKLDGDAYQLAGEADYFLDDYDNAITNYGSAIDRYERAVDVGGADDAVSGALLITYWSRGNTLIELDRASEAAVDYAAAIGLAETAVARDPGDITSARRLTILKGSNALALVRLGDRDEAMRLMYETNAWFESQAAQDPDTPSAQRSVPINYEMTADILSYAGETAAACDWYQRALAAWVEIDGRLGLSEFDAGEPDKLREIIADCR